ncbi:S-layer family protein [Bradyrhizobium liaoningense]|uniref:beta strand repeat-containing protein n=1 Tax=Bradyrhizobium liaoningense TaxID=43992 RepID=UPI001BA655C1|nr:VCBS domain-containing protein [Bradyrhizobium liaoningense]MBR0717254.1 VCBS domain-containing protein [Bradyrhizobium liaoningense]
MATQTTGGGSTVSFGNTPQANNDIFSFTEDASNILILNVLANDLGGAAKTLFSLDDGTSASASTKNYAPADLQVKDVAYSSDAAGMVGTGDRSALGARIWIESDGTVHYDKGDINAQLQALAAGQTLTDTFTYAIQLGNGTLSWATVTLQFNGANDLVSITSSAQSGSVVEDANTTPDLSDSQCAAGTISFNDADLSDNHSASCAAAASNTTALGTFSLDPCNEALNAANGSVQWHYTLNNSAAQYLAAGQSITESFVVTINDSHGSTATQMVTVTITGTNDAATVSSDSKSVTETDTAAALNTSGQLTIVDPDTGEAHVVAQSNAHGTYGDFSIDANGAWSYAGNGAHDELIAGQQVQDQFTVVSQDGTATGTVTVTITGTNDAATVSSDSKSVTEGDTATALNTSGQLTIVDPDTGEAHVVAQTNAHGTYGDFSIDANGAWSYAGNGAHDELIAGQQVQDQFTVTSQDGTASGTVTVTITGTNDAATVSSDSKSVTEGDSAAALNTSGQLTITDPDTGEAHVVAQTNAHGSYGDFTIDANGAWSYTGNGAHDELTAGQQVQDQFTVTSQDGTATGTVTVTITGTNDAATVSSESKSVTEGDSAAALNTSGQLTIVDPDTGEAHVVAQTDAHGTYGEFTIDANGTWSYTGNGAHDELIAGQQVQDQFTVTSQDGTATGTVTVTITGTNDTATVSSDSKSVTEGDTAAALNTSGQLTIMDPDTGEAHVVAQTNAHGTYGDFSIDANGAWSYTGNGAHNELIAGQQVQDQFTVTSQDGTASGTVTVTITGTNDAATVSSDTKSVTEGDTASALNTSGQLTITDPDTGEAYVVAQNNAHGTYGDFTIDANGTWSYTGNGAHNELIAGQQVQDQFTVTSQDGTATGTVTVTITGTNDAATVSSDAKSVTEGDTAATLNTSGQLTIVDPDTGEAHVVAQSNVHGTYGDFSIDANGAWSYTGNGAHDELIAGQQVQDQFTVTSQDGTATGTVTVTITGTNDAPGAVNDTSASADATAATEKGGTANGSGGSNATGNVIANDTDVDSGGLTVSAIRTGGTEGAGAAGTLGTGLVGAHGTLTLDPNGSYTYVVNENDAAVQALNVGQTTTDTFNYTVTDGSLTDTAVLMVTINGANDAPVGVNDTSASAGATAATEKGGTANGSGGVNGSGNVLANDTDVDSGGLTVSAIRTGGTEGAGTAGTLGAGLVGAHGTLTLNPNGSYTYVVNENDAAVQALNAGQTTTDVFNYTVTDGSLTDTAVLTVTINGANDAPVNTVPGQQTVGNGNGGGSTANFALRVSDVDNGTETVSLSLGNSPQSSTGILTLSTTSGLTFSSGANGTKAMTFSGSTSDINAALASVTFSGGSNNSTRTLTMTTTDGGGLADTDTVTIVKGSGANVLTPAGIAGEAINLALVDPSDDLNDVITVTIGGVPLGWRLSDATSNGDGTWTAQTTNVQSMTITSPTDFTGAIVLNVTLTWTNADGSTGTATVADNVEAYAQGSPIFAVSGDDHLTASSGNDLLVFSQPIGHDVVYSFDAMHDQIDLIDYANFTSFADIQAHTVSDANGNAVIELGEGQSITLQGVDPTSLTASDFVFDQTPVTHNAGHMTIGNGAILPLSGTIDNAGTIELNSTGAETDLQLVEHGILLEGGGQVILSDNSENTVNGAASDVTLTNVDNTIAGAGHLGAGTMILVNQGTIVATGANVLEIDTGGNTVVNSGTLEATGSGGLVIDSNVDNSGLLWAHGANITLNGSVSGSGTALMDGVATFEFGAASSANVALEAAATGTIVLHDSFDFSGIVSGFDGDDHLDLLDVAFGAGTTASYIANQAGTGGTLSVTDGVHTANITLLGQYDPAGFQAEADKNTGTLISYHDLA